jgi:hypothetical protein
MKTIAIGDIHGRNIWRKIVDLEQPDRVIFIGDYFDSFDIPGLDQIYNFQSILAWKEATPQCEVIMLIGNHDYHYFPELLGKCTCSGFQRALYPEISRVINENRHHLSMAYQLDKYLFTHAGISREWLIHHGWDGAPIADYVNDLWTYKPLAFNFADTAYGHSDPYGDDTWQTPLWIRPRSLMRAAKSLKKEYTQIVGHTAVKQIDAGKATGGRYYFIDCFDHIAQYLQLQENNNKYTIQIKQLPNGNNE